MNTLSKETILKKGQKVAKFATLATIFLAAAKALAGFLSGSILLTADAIHSAVDTVAIFSSWFGLKISQKKYSKKFPYGYYKAENFAALIASLFILFAAYEIFKESWVKLFVLPSLGIPALALLVPLISAIVSYFIAIYENKIGKEINSQSLIANAQESKFDVISSLIVFGGVFLAYFNIRYVEGILSMALALVIFKIGYQNAKIAVFSLMDASLDKQLEEDVEKTIVRIKEVKKVANLKLRQSGLFVFGEANIELSKNLNVEQAHDIADKIEAVVKKKYAKIGNLFIHIEPFKTETIKILIPVSSSEDLNAKTVDHFARAPYFLFVVIKNGRIISSYIKKNPFFKQEIRSGLAASKEALKEKIDVVLTKRIGEISFHMLRDALVNIYLTRGESAKRAINNFIAGRLKKLAKPTHLSDKTNK